jgi:cytochrome c2/heme/copper-type cytochrome/quinol oxidase subunit 4
MATSHETEHSGGGHPSLKQYAFIAILLFAITIVEFVIIMDFPGEAEKVIADALGQPSTTILLFLLSGIKFAIVILFYMHLKFDNKFFFWVFIAGMVLAVMVGLALMGLFTAVKPTLGGEPRLPDVAAPCVFDHEIGEHGENVCPDPTPQPTSTPAPTLEALAITAPVAVAPSAGGSGEPTAAEGERLANEVYGCNACHSTDGTVLVGPSWQGIWGTQEALEGGGSATVDEDYVRESIHDPAAKLVAGFGNLMPVLGLTDPEIDSIIEYIKTLN